MNVFSGRPAGRLPRNGPDPASLADAVNRWFRTRQGRAVLTAERKLALPLISRMFGYHILQLDCGDGHSLVEDSPAGHKVLFSAGLRPGTRGAVASNEALPLANDSMDAVVVHHALDFAEDCHGLLREAARVLRPGGKMLVIGFNPVSHWGLWRLFRRRSAVPWRARFISRRRLTDWLKLLDMRIELVQHGLHFLPLNIRRLLVRSRRMESLGAKIKSPFGGAYCVLCVKQVAPVTPVLTLWRPRRRRAAAIPAAEGARAGMH